MEDADEPEGEGLGELVRVHGHNGRFARWLSFMGFGIAAAGLTFTVLGLRSSEAKWKVPLIVFGIFFLGVGVLLLLAALIGSRKQFCLHEEGFVYQGSWQRFSCRWDEVESILLSPPNEHSRQQFPSFQLVSTSNQIAWISDEGFADYPKLLGRVSRALCEVQLPRCLRRIEAGKKVAFGPLTATAQGLGCGRSSARRTLPWTSIDAIAEREGGLVFAIINGRPEPLHASLADVPNLPVLQELASQLGNRKG